MRRALFLSPLLILSACRESPSAAEAPRSACESRSFEGSRFTVCDAARGRLELVAAARTETAVRQFADLETRLGARASKVAFAMNAGMFDEDGRPIGLAIVEGRQVHAVNRREGGGNFHLMPNGVFQVLRDGTARILPTARWKPSSDIRLATQSGPMLVIAGKVHPRFDADGTSRYIRNGVGVGPTGRPLFAISEDPVSFGKFARFFRDALKCRDALFFDGSVSALWDPSGQRRDITVPLGPMIVAFRPAESAPGREGRARP